MRTSCWVALAAMALAIGGCGPAGEPPVTVGLVSPALTSTFHVTLIQGAEEQGEAFGWKVESLVYRRPIRHVQERTARSLAATKRATNQGHSTGISSVSGLP